MANDKVPYIGLKALREKAGRGVTALLKRNGQEKTQRGIFRIDQIPFIETSGENRRIRVGDYVNFGGVSYEFNPGMLRAQAFL